jgi:FkbM family methyltransferase
MNLFEQLDSPISLIDVGAVGDLPAHWLPLAPHLSVYGFEPDEEACKALNEQANRFAQACFHPVVVGGAKEERPFNITRHGECSSLLLPHQDWLDRFSYGSCFEIIRSPVVITRSLDEIEYHEEDGIDAIKIDSQGMELPIFKGAEKTLESTFLLEVETGLHENYHDETTFDQIAPYLRSKGFTCLQLRNQPSETRNNTASGWARNQGQPMACESIWLRDLVGSESHSFPMTRSKAFRCLTLCANFGFLDFGLELAGFFLQSGLLNKNEFSQLEIEDSWVIEKEEIKPRLATLLAHLTHLLPTPLRRDLAAVLPEVIEKPNFLKHLFRIDRR